MKYEFSKVLSLIGKSKTGKTYTIFKLINIIKEKHPELKEIVSSKPRKQNIEETFVFTLNDKLYLITTIGDGIKYIEQELKFVESNYGVKIKDVDYFVCASHRGNTKDELMKKSKICYFHDICAIENGENKPVYDDDIQFAQAEMLYGFMIKMGAFK